MRDFLSAVDNSALETWRERHSGEGAAPVDSSRFRTDVEGLRAVAVGLVLVYHSGLPFLPGGFAGVDVFFVISGFLITGQLVREIEATGTVSLHRFYARRAKRLFPASATVLVATVAMVTALVPKTRWEEIGGDIVASSLYVANWRFASRSVDYLAEDSAPSPLLHFWSLAVEEQFYLVWPVLLLGLAGLIRWRHASARPVMAAGLSLITVPSFLWSVHATDVERASAYFATTTRLWELGIGALVAVGSVLWTRLPRTASAAIGWAGLAAILAGAMLHSTSTAWPGSAALVPTLGTAAVIIGGFSAGREGPVTVLGRRPLRWIGGLSYSLYLWHWPIVVIGAAHLGGLTATRGTLLVLLSLIPAVLTYELVEQPLRRASSLSRSSRLALSFGANLTLMGVVSGALLVFAAMSALAPASPADVKGAAVLGTGPEPLASAAARQPVSITPHPLKAPDDVPRLYADGCQVKHASNEIMTCEYGDTQSDRVVAVVGDSKIAQWLPSIIDIAAEEGWKVRTYTKSSCPWTSATVRHRTGPYTACLEWGRKVYEELTGAGKPWLVITSGVRSAAIDQVSGRDSVELMVAGYKSYWGGLGEHGVPVIALSDSPHPGMAVYECVSEYPDDYMRRCSFTKKDGAGSAALKAAVERVSTSVYVDMNPWLCPTEMCPPVIGNVLVWRQGSHITATYAKTLTPILRRSLVPTADQRTMHVREVTKVSP